MIPLPIGRLFVFAKRDRVESATRKNTSRIRYPWISSLKQHTGNESECTRHSNAEIQTTFFPQPFSSMTFRGRRSSTPVYTYVYTPSFESIRTYVHFWRKVILIFKLLWKDKRNCSDSSFFLIQLILLISTIRKEILTILNCFYFCILAIHSDKFINYLYLLNYNIYE